MKTTIKITIDCDEEYCGDCQLLRISDSKITFCTGFCCHKDYLCVLKNDGSKVKRCQQCLDSEVK